MLSAVVSKFRRHSCKSGVGMCAKILPFRLGSSLSMLCKICKCEDGGSDAIPVRTVPQLMTMYQRLTQKHSRIIVVCTGRVRTLGSFP